MLFIQKILKLKLELDFYNFKSSLNYFYHVCLSYTFVNKSNILLTCLLVVLGEFFEQLNNINVDLFELKVFLRLLNASPKVIYIL